MRMFISWSGERSRVIAGALHDWLPRVIQAVQPFMSETDIGKGSRWEQEIGSQLQQANFGIFCLTPENLDSRWINFEAGAISKTLDRTYVCTYLLELNPADIDGPLSQFNHTKAVKDDTKRLIQTINQALEEQALNESVLNDTFDLNWARFDQTLGSLPTGDEKREPPRKMEDMVEETLELVRSISNKSTQTYITVAGLPEAPPITSDMSPAEIEFLSHYRLALEDIKKNEKAQMQRAIDTWVATSLRNRPRSGDSLLSHVWKQMEADKKKGSSDEHSDS